MKILITTDLFTTDTNGVVTSTKNLWRELLSKGHDVRIMTLSETSHSYKDEENNVYFVKSSSLGFIYPNIRMPISYRNAYIKELIEWSPDIIHSQCEFFSFEFALHISKKTGAPIVHTYHTMYEDYVSYVMPSKKLGKRLVRWFSKKTLNKTAVSIAPTEKVKDALLRYGVSSPIHVVPSGIDLDKHKVHIDKEDILKKRRELGISDDSTVLINLGRLGHEKNIDELITLFAKASETNKDLYFLIVGGGPAKDELEKHSDSLGLSDRIIFTGMVAPEDVQYYYRMGDIFVSASTSETQGLTYIEAAANGLPLLCRQDPCLDAVLISGANGYSYTDEEEFINRIDAMCKDREWLSSASAKSKEISEKFDKTVFGNKLEEIYLSLLK